LGEIILGSVLGMLVEVIEGLAVLTSPELLVAVATAILDGTESDLAVSVPVGLMLSGAVVVATEDVTAGRMDPDSEVGDAELAIAGIMLDVAAVVLFSVDGAFKGAELSVDTGTTETPVLEVGAVLLLSEALRPVDGEVLEVIVGAVVGVLSELTPEGVVPVPVVVSEVTLEGTEPVPVPVPVIVSEATLEGTESVPVVVSEVTLGAAEPTKEEALEATVETTSGATEAAVVVLGAIEAVKDVPAAAVDVA
jgi:hypothetical protein